MKLQINTVNTKKSSVSRALNQLKSKYVKFARIRITPRRYEVKDNSLYTRLYINTLPFYMMFKSKCKDNGNLIALKENGDANYFGMPDNGIYKFSFDKTNYVIAIVYDYYDMFKTDKNRLGEINELFIDMYFVGNNIHKYFYALLEKRDVIYQSLLIKWGKCSKYVNINNINANDFIDSQSIVAKSMHDIILPIDIKKFVFGQIGKFLKSKDVYNRYNIPYKLGIFIYGPPGTGKSSFAYALAKKLNVSVQIIDRDQIINCSYKEVPSFSKKKVNYIYLIEEIDSIIDSEYAHNNKNVIITKDILLKYIDGIPEKSIVIATSNAKLNEMTGSFVGIDDAIIRPGRFDIHFKMGLFNKPEAIKMIKKYDLPESFADRFNYPIIPSKLEFECTQEIMENMLINEKEGN